MAAGGTFIDTADVHGRGAGEELIGRWLAARARDAIGLATNVRFPMGEGLNEVGTSRQHILAGVEQSLRWRRTDDIDRYQVHCWDPVTRLEETLSPLNDRVLLPAPPGPHHAAG